MYIIIYIILYMYIIYISLQIRARRWGCAGTPLLASIGEKSEKSWKFLAPTNPEHLGGQKHRGLKMKHNAFFRVFRNGQKVPERKSWSLLRHFKEPPRGDTPPPLPQGAGTPALCRTLLPTASLNSGELLHSTELRAPTPLPFVPSHHFIKLLAQKLVYANLFVGVANYWRRWNVPECSSCLPSTFQDMEDLLYLTKTWQPT